MRNGSPRVRWWGCRIRPIPIRTPRSGSPKRSPRTFAAQSEQRDQQRREQLTLVARLLPFSPDDAFTFLDLGAGTGAASRAVLAEYPRANAILGEYSPQMAAEGTRAMAAYVGRYRYVELDMLAPDWSLVGGEPLDAIVSALSIHHMPDDRKRTIFGDIYAHLRPRGWYVNYDPIRAPDETLEAIWERVNDRYDPEAPAQAHPPHRAGAGALREPRPLHDPAAAPARVAARRGLHERGRLLETPGLGDLRRQPARVEVRTQTSEIS